MLPPGHIAAGYLATYALLKTTHAQLPPQQFNVLLGLGAFFAFAPDLDTFMSFAKAKSFILIDGKHSHRKFFSHAPLVWLIPSLAIIFFTKSAFGTYLGLTVWAGSWSHFVLDSLQHGIMWLWPFNKKLFALKDREFSLKELAKKESFVGYWTEFVWLYFTQLKFSSYLELIIIISALTVFLTSIK